MSSRTILRVDIEKATQNKDEMEQLGLIRFDEFGNVGILVLDGQSKNELQLFSISEHQNVIITPKVGVCYRGNGISLGHMKLEVKVVCWF